eukprot:gene20961-23797_t
MGGLKFLTILLVLFARSAFARDSSDSIRGGDLDKFPHHSQVEILATQYTYTGAYQAITVPAGAITMVATLYGAAGGVSVSAGGKGAMIAANIPVIAGQTYYLWIGGAASGIVAGWNGGGAGYGSYSGGGGGGTDLRTSGNSLNDRILVAGGGGGASSNCGSSGGGYPGGGGGYPSGLSGPLCGTYPINTPGSANAGGTIDDPENCVASNNGGFGVGGAACSSAGLAYGGAGGGGWYGGAGSYGSTGAGGSSYSANGPHPGTHHKANGDTHASTYIHSDFQTLHKPYFHPHPDSHLQPYNGANQAANSAPDGGPNPRSNLCTDVRSYLFPNAQSNVYSNGQANMCSDMCAHVCSNGQTDLYTDGQPYVLSNCESHLCPNGEPHLRSN